MRLQSHTAQRAAAVLRTTTAVELWWSWRDVSVIVFQDSFCTRKRRKKREIIIRIRDKALIFFGFCEEKDLVMAALFPVIYSALLRDSLSKPFSRLSFHSSTLSFFSSTSSLLTQFTFHSSAVVVKSTQYIDIGVT